MKNLRASLKSRRLDSECREACPSLIVRSVPIMDVSRVQAHSTIATGALIENSLSDTSDTPHPCGIAALHLRSEGLRCSMSRIRGILCTPALSTHRSRPTPAPPLDVLEWLCAIVCTACPANARWRHLQKRALERTIPRYNAQARERCGMGLRSRDPRERGPGRTKLQRCAESRTVAIDR